MSVTPTHKITKKDKESVHFSPISQTNQTVKHQVRLKARRNRIGFRYLLQN
jgi:hypothetical protein